MNSIERSGEMSGLFLLPDKFGQSEERCGGNSGIA